MIETVNTEVAARLEEWREYSTNEARIGFAPTRIEGRQVRGRGGACLDYYFKRAPSAA